MAKKKDVSPHCTESFLFKDQLYHYPNKEWFIEKENEVLGVNLKSIMGQAKLKLEKYDYTQVREIKEASEQSNELKSVRVAGVVKSLEYRPSQKDIYFYWIEIVDDTSTIKAYCNRKTFETFNTHILKGKCSLFNISVRNGFISFDKCVLMDIVPFKAGYILQIDLPYGMFTTAIKEYIEDELDVTIRRGNVQVYLRTYGYDLFIDPTYDLIDNIFNKFGVECNVRKINEVFNDDEIMKYLEENGY